MYIDETITFDEAERRGYNELQFIIEYLEDETGSTRLFNLDGKKILVMLNEERTQATKKKEKVDNISTVSINMACNLDDPECLSCGS